MMLVLWVESAILHIQQSATEGEVREARGGRKRRDKGMREGGRERDEQRETEGEGGRGI